MTADISTAAKTPLAAGIASLRGPVIAVAVISLFLNVLAFVSPLFMLQIYDRVLSSRNETTLVMLTIIAVVLLFSYGLLEHFRHEILVHASVRFDTLTSDPSFDAALQAGLKTRGGQHAQILRDVDAMREFIGGHGILTLLDVPWAPLFMAVCFMFHPLIGIVAAGGATAIFALAWLNDRITKAPLSRANRLNIGSFDYLAGSLRNAEAIKSMGMAQAFRGRWSAKHHDALSASVTANERGGRLLAISKFVRQTLYVAILAVGAYLVLEQQITGGVMFAASLIMGKALAPVEQAVAQWRSLVGVMTAKARLSAVLAAFPAAQKRLKLPAPNGHLEVEGITVLAPGTNSVLVRNVSFSLRAGEILAIVGPTGSGKSTLARSLVGAWPVAAGAIRVDGNDLRHWDADQIGGCLGYLPQDIELFEGSVADNIARFGGSDDEGVIAAATLANAHEIVQRLPNGYETQVGNDGGGLSGGQRQRVGLARAIYGAPALIVLDEPNSNLDGDGEIALLRAIRSLKEAGTTVIIVTHKPNILAAVDKLLIMQDGQVRSFGPRDEVLPNLIAPPPHQLRTVAAA